MEHYRVLKTIFFFCIIAAFMPLIVYGKKDKSSSSSDKNAEIQKQIKEDESAIQDAENEKANINSNISDVKKVIDSLQSQKGNLEGVVKELDSSLAGIQSEINGLNTKIDELDKDLEDLDDQIKDKESDVKKASEELDAAREALEGSYNDTKEHIKYMYETRNATIWDLLFGAEGIKDLLNRTKYITSMTEYDKGRLDEYAVAVSEVEKKKEELEKEEEELSELKTEIEGTKEEISDEKKQVKAKEADVSLLLQAKEQEINAYNADISSKEEQIKEYEKMIAEQDAVIRALESSIAARKAAMASGEDGEEGEQEGLPKYDGGQFAFPCPSYTRISDDYGNRIHPILGVQQFHNGVDLAAASGSPILAAYDGEVIAAAYSSTMGNYVMIDHGDELYTIYMHASSLSVSTGQKVTKGQKIASVGSTGRSTGPHLHFSVRKNGNYVSPWNYLK